VPRLTRRRALELAGAATTLAAVRPASAGAASFSQDVPLTGRPVRAPARFDLIGLDFGRAAHVHAEVRARPLHGRWTAWTPVHDATQPVWTGPADVFQVRYRGVARRLTARLVRSGPAPRAVAARAKRRGSGQPPIISRAEWGGDKVKPRESPIYGEVDLAFVHHTVTANDYGPEDSAGIVLGIARYHRDHNGWNDIGYQFLVDKYGQIFEGRDGGIELAVVGAQAQGYNSVSTGVSCIGDYTSGPLTEDGIDSLTRLLAWKLSVHGVPCKGRVTVKSLGGETNRYAYGRRVTLDRISGHRDGDATSCPGSALYGQLPAIRSRADELSRTIAALTIGATETEVTYPDTAVDLSGLLRFGDEADPTGAQIQIQYQSAPGQGWATVASATADAEGAYAVTVSMGPSGRLRALHVADGIHEEQTSTAIEVKVLPALTLEVDGTTISVSAQPTTQTRGRIVVQRRARGRWRLVDKHRVTLVDGAYSEEFTATRAGRYRVTFQSGGATVRRRVSVRA
jgi:hypothetical protein